MIINWWLFIGITIIVLGFSFKIDSLVVVIVAAIVTALIGGIGFVEVLEILGSRFVMNRGMTVLILTLPIIRNIGAIWSEGTGRQIDSEGH